MLGELIPASQLGFGFGGGELPDALEVLFRVEEARVGYCCRGEGSIEEDIERVGLHFGSSDREMLEFEVWIGKEEEEEGGDMSPIIYPKTSSWISPHGDI